MNNSDRGNCNALYIQSEVKGQRIDINAIYGWCWFQPSKCDIESGLIGYNWHLAVRVSVRVLVSIRLLVRVWYIIWSWLEFGFIIIYNVAIHAIRKINKKHPKDVPLYLWHAYLVIVKFLNLVNLSAKLNFSDFMPHIYHYINRVFK
jgi:hypothetical protein